ncbi:TPA: hypothetical protein ACWYG6_005355, partial [Citrobacter braakii]
HDSTDREAQHRKLMADGVLVNSNGSSGRVSVEACKQLTDGENIPLFGKHASDLATYRQCQNIRSFAKRDTFIQRHPAPQLSFNPGHITVKVYRTVADNLINVVTALYATVDPIDIVRFQTSPHRLVFFGRTLRGIKWSCLTYSIQAH